MASFTVEYAWDASPPKIIVHSSASFYQYLGINLVKNVLDILTTHPD